MKFYQQPRQACSQVEVQIDACAAQGGRAWRTEFFLIWGPNSVADRFFFWTGQFVALLDDRAVHGGVFSISRSFSGH